jgi:hypothetical protein
VNSKVSIGPKARLLVALAAAASLGLAGVAVAPVASANATISVVSSGPSVLSTYTYQDSDEGYAVFTVTDPSRQGTQVSQCWVDSDDGLYDCDIYPLRETDYRDGDWRIRPTASGWEIRVYLAYQEMDDEQCLDQFKGAGQEGVDIAILGDFEEVLGEGRHSYEVVCQGYVGTSKGGSKITAYVGRASRALPISVRAIDAAHQAARAQGCIYSTATGRATNCLALDMAASRTSRGWIHERRIGINALTARQCQAIKRTPAKFIYRVVFKDSVGDTLMVVNHRFSVTCR